MEKREPSYTVGGNVENSVEAPLKKIKIELPYDLSNPILGHIPGENHNSKRYIHASVYCSTIYSSQDMKATLMSISRGMDKRMWYIHTMEYYLTI